VPSSVIRNIEAISPVKVVDLRWGKITEGSPTSLLTGREEPANTVCWREIIAEEGSPSQAQLFVVG